MSLKGTEFTGESAVYYDHVATGVDGDVAFYVEEARSAGSSSRWRRRDSKSSGSMLLTTCS